MIALRGAWLPAVLLLCAVSARAQSVELFVSADSVTVGERFTLSVTAEHDFAADPAFPDPALEDSMVFGDLEVLQRRRFERPTSDGMRIDSVVYEVTTFALDTARVAPIPVLFTAGEDTFTVRTEDTWVPVISLVPADAQDIRDLAPLVEFPSPVWMYVAAAAALLLLAALVLLYVWRRRRRADRPARAPSRPPVPPDVEAYRRLRRLEQVDLTRNESVKPFYVELSGTLRHYLDRRLGVPALERTTGELIGELRRRDVPDMETTGRLRNVLTQSDFVKFADARPPAGEGTSLIATARSIIDSIETALKPSEQELAAEEEARAAVGANTARSGTRRRS